MIPRQPGRAPRPLGPGRRKDRGPKDADPSAGPPRSSAVSRLTTARLSVYLRCLGELESRGVRTVSSRDMAAIFHLNPAQIRKDLAHFGEFGTRGVGYDVPGLRRSLVRILGLDREHRLVIVGAGNLGVALAGYRGFSAGGFRIAALFDNDPRRIAALRKEGWPVHPSAEIGRVVAETGATIAVLAVPAPAGQECLDEVARAGIRAVLSFVPVQLRVPEGVAVSTVDLKIQLEGLAFGLGGEDGPEHETVTPRDGPGRRRG